MNNDRRNRIGAIKSSLDELKSLLETLAGEERDAFDNMPENMQSSDRGEKAEAAAEALECAVQSIEESFDSLDEATS